MPVELMEPTKENKKEWNDFVGSNGGTVFHLFEWGEIFKAAYNYTPKYFVASDSNNGRPQNALSGIMPAVISNNIFGCRLVSMPFLDYAGPLGSDSSSVELLSSVLGLARVKGYKFECYSLQDFCAKLNSMLTGNAQLTSYHSSDSFTLDTTIPYEAIWNLKFDKKVRNLVRKSEKSGVKVRKETPAFLPKYYNIYVRTMKKLGSLPQSFRLFSEIAKRIGQKFEIYSANYEDQPVAGMIAFRFNQRLHIWGNVSLEESLSVAPNNALYNEIIRSACETGINEVDFGSTALGSSHHKFKADWGGNIRPIYCLTNRTSPEGSRSGNSLKNTVVRVIPTPFLGGFGGLAFEYIY